MTNPFNRGSSPDRARDASQRSGTFKPGHKKLGLYLFLGCDRFALFDRHTNLDHCPTGGSVSRSSIQQRARTDPCLTTVISLSALFSAGWKFPRSSMGTT